MQDAKGSVERFQIDRFVELLREPIRVLSQCEAPDFVCVHGGQRIGVELTRLKRKLLSEVAGAQRKIVLRAQAKAVERGMEPVAVKVWFGDRRIDLSGGRVDAAAAYLCDAVEQSMELIRNGNGQSVRLDTSWNRIGVILMTASSGKMNGIAWLPDHRWETQEPGFVSRSSGAELQGAIDAKNHKYLEYRKETDECWLVVVVDRSNRDAHFDHSQMDQSAIYGSMFARTYPPVFVGIDQIELYHGDMLDEAGSPFRGTGYAMYQYRSRGGLGQVIPAFGQVPTMSDAQLHMQEFANYEAWGSPITYPKYCYFGEDSRSIVFEDFMTNYVPDADYPASFADFLTRLPWSGSLLEEMQ